MSLPASFYESYGNKMLPSLTYRLREKPYFVPSGDNGSVSTMVLTNVECDNLSVSQNGYINNLTVSTLTYSGGAQTSAVSVDATIYNQAGQSTWNQTLPAYPAFDLFEYYPPGGAGNSTMSIVMSNEWKTAKGLQIDFDVLQQGSANGVRGTIGVKGNDVIATTLPSASDPASNVPAGSNAPYTYINTYAFDSNAFPYHASLFLKNGQDYSPSTSYLHFPIASRGNNCEFGLQDLVGVHYRIVPQLD